MDKLKDVLQSRKFWALVIASSAIWTAFSVGGLSIQDAINAQVAALAAYSIGTGLETQG